MVKAAAKKMGKLSIKMDISSLEKSGKKAASSFKDVISATDYLVSTTSGLIDIWGAAGNALTPLITQLAIKTGAIKLETAAESSNAIIKRVGMRILQKQRVEKLKNKFIDQFNLGIITKDTLITKLNTISKVALGVATKTTTKSVWGLAAAMMGTMGPFILIGAAIAGVIAAVTLLNKENRELREATKQTAKDIAGSRQEYEKLERQAEQTSKEIDNLIQRIYDLNNNGNNDNTEELEGLMARLKQLLPGVSIELDDITKSVKQSRTEVQKYADSWEVSEKVARAEKEINRVQEDRAEILDTIKQLSEDYANGNKGVYDSLLDNVGLLKDLNIEEAEYQALLAQYPEYAEEALAARAEYDQKVEERDQAILEAKAKYHQDMELATQKHLSNMGSAYDDSIHQTDISAGQVKLNYEQQTKDMEKWLSDLDKIAAKGKDDLANQLAELGPEAGKWVAQIADYTGPQLDEFEKTMNDRSKAAKKAAERELGDLSDVEAAVTEEWSGTLEEFRLKSEEKEGEIGKAAQSYVDTYADNIIYQLDQREIDTVNAAEEYMIALNDAMTGSFPLTPLPGRVGGSYAMTAQYLENAGNVDYSSIDTSEASTGETKPTIEEQKASATTESWNNYNRATSASSSGKQQTQYNDNELSWTPYKAPDIFSLDPEQFFVNGATISGAHWNGMLSTCPQGIENLSKESQKSKEEIIKPYESMEVETTANVVASYDGMVNTINAKSPEVEESTKTLRKRMDSRLRGQKEEGPNKTTMKMGEFFVDGAVIGMDNKAQSAYDKAKQIANGVASRFGDTWEVRSPSRKAIGLSTNFIKGLTIGMAKGDALIEMSGGLARGMTDRMHSTFNSYGNTSSSVNNNTYNTTYQAATLDNDGANMADFENRIRRAYA